MCFLRKTDYLIQKSNHYSQGTIRNVRKSNVLLFMYSKGLMYVPKYMILWLPIEYNLFKFE